LTPSPTVWVQKSALRAEAASRTVFDNEVAAASKEMVSAIPAPSITTNVDDPMRTRRLDRGAEL
jgi:hypothetical protein